jgi:hypothetical protein
LNCYARGHCQFATKRRKTPQNAAKKPAKCRKYSELAISLCRTKYLGGLKKTHPLFRSVEINCGPKLGGHGSLSPLKSCCLVSSRPGSYCLLAGVL